MDTFNKAYKNIQVSNNSLTIKACGSKWSSDYGNAYGRTAMNSTMGSIYEWKFNIHKRYRSLFIGIASHTDINADWEKIDYAYDGYDGTKCHFGKEESYGSNRFNSGDTVCMKVDFKTKTISYNVNNNGYRIAFENITDKPKYYMVVSIYTDTKYNASVSITDFNCSNIFEEKQNDEMSKFKEENNKLTKKSQQLQQQIIHITQQLNTQSKTTQEILEQNGVLNAENNALKRKLNNVQDNGTILTQKLYETKIKGDKEKKQLTDQYKNQKKENINLQQQLNNKHNEISILNEENDQLNAETNALKRKLKNVQDNGTILTQKLYETKIKADQYENQKKENINLQQELNIVKAENNELLDDKKEMEMRINELVEENKKLNVNNLDYSKWKEWNSEQIYYFIMSICNDGSLQQYKNDIKKEIFESEYSGNDLIHIEINDIKAMGIKKISIRKMVFKAIKNLTQNKSQIDEGIASNAPTAYI